MKHGECCCTVQLRQDIGHILLVIGENHKALSNIVAVLMSLQDEVNSLRDTLRRQQSTSFVIQPPSSSSGPAAAAGPPPAATAASSSGGGGFVAALTRKRSHELRPESTSSSTDKTSRKSSKTSQ